MTSFLCWHYIFMDYPLTQLKDRGFSIENELDISKHSEFFKLDPQLGFESRILPLMGNSLSNQNNCFLDYREVFDESDFIKLNPHKSGALRELLKPGIKIINPNIRDNLALDFKGFQFEFVKGQINHENLKWVSNDYYFVGFYVSLGFGESQELIHQATNLGLQDSEIQSLQIAKAQDPQFSFFQHRKDFSIWSVVLRAKNDDSFKKMQQISEPIEACSWVTNTTSQEASKTHQALIIKNHITQWDLVILSP